MTDPITRLNSALEGRYGIGGTVCSWLRAVRLIAFLSPALAGCYSTRTSPLPQPPNPIQGDVAAVILSDGERIPVGNTDLELSGQELIVRDTSGSELRRIPASDIESLEIVDFHRGRTALAVVGIGYPLIVTVALSAGNAPE